MLSRFKRKLYRSLAQGRGLLKIEDAQPPRIFRYKRYARSTSKLALLSYLPEFVIDQAEGRATYQFSNVGLARTLPKVLNQLGYEVDIVSWEDQTFTPTRSYDLFIGHGAKNFELLLKSLQPKPTIIYFSTGSYWRFHNHQQDQRLLSFKSRHAMALPRYRYIDVPEEDANRHADAIVCLGNEGTHQTYKDFPRVYNLPIATYLDSKFIPAINKQRQSNFLFFSGGGNIHKGLDLLLDAFGGASQHLYICTLLDPAFEKYYQDALYHSENIHYKGLVSQRSAEFYEIVNQCGFTILPSCSEGSPGSVVDTMQYGLIPIVTKEAHIDVGDFGMVLPDSTVEDLVKSLSEAAKMTWAEFLTRSELSQQAAKSYSVENFEHNLAAIIMSITAGK